MNLIENLKDLIISLLEKKVINFNEKFTKITYENKDKFNELLDHISYNKNYLELFHKYYSSIYYNEDQTIIILINFLNHIQIYGICYENHFDFMNIFSNVFDILKNISTSINFEFNKNLGFLNSEINYIGHGLNLYSELILSIFC